MHGIAVFVIVVLFGCYWCYVVLARLPDDMTELCQKSGLAAKVSIIVVWIITAFIVVALLAVAKLSIVEFRIWF